MIENQVLFFKIASWLVWPIGGVILGLLTGRQRNLDIKTLYTWTGIGYLIGIMIAAAGYLGLSIWVPTYQGVPLNWGEVFLKYAIQIAIFYFANLVTALWVHSAE